MSDALDTLRARIDDVDRRLVELLNERARLVVDVGRVKRSDGTPIYAPHRESQVLSRVLAMSAGPLPARAVEAVFREIMSGSFALERGLTVAVLGPAGSFSHLAASRHFGASATVEARGSIAEVFAAIVRGEASCGLVPIENSLQGGIAETLDGLVRHAGRVRPYAEAQVEVRHCLAGLCEVERVTRVYSKVEALAQCRRFLGERLPGAAHESAPSTSAAMQRVAAEGEGSGSAAIGSVLAAELYGLDVLAECIEDEPGNVTRFLVLSRESAAPTGDDKTAVLFRTADKPGALAGVLGDFERSGINLTHIDKRPAGKSDWTYTFLVEAGGHERDEAMRLAVDRARAHCQELTVLGSYPRSRRVLT